MVRGWPKKAMIEVFMGGLKVKIVDDISMFQPRSLKEAISLVRM